MSQRKIRDFIYLDIERVSSALAQAIEGLPSERIHSSQHQVGGQGEARARLPLVAEAGGSADYHYVRSSSETQSLHDQVFEELRKALETQGYLADLTNIKPADWVPDFFRDGTFVVTQAPLKIIDYAAMISALQGLPSLVDALVKLTPTQGAQQGRESGRAGKPKGPLGNTAAQSASELSGIRNQVKGLPLDAMAKLVNGLYGQVVRLKVFPVAEHAEMVFVGTADTTSFRYAPARVTNVYGSVIDADWMCLLQINKGEYAEPGALVSQTGNTVEDSLEQLYDLVSNVGAAAQRIQFPAVAVTPIAIYREIPSLIG